MHRSNEKSCIFAYSRAFFQVPREHPIPLEEKANEIVYDKKILGSLERGGYWYFDSCSVGGPERE